MQKVLVLCTGNSCRSIMAEALINHLGQGRYMAVSAGSRPTGQVHPQALAALARAGIPAGNPTSKTWDVFSGQAFDLVITVCDQAAGESCPAFLGKAQKLHWSTPDPATATGTPAEVAAVFDSVLARLRERVDTVLLVQEPPHAAQHRLLPPKTA